MNQFVSLTSIMTINFSLLVECCKYSKIQPRMYLSANKVMVIYLTYLDMAERLEEVLWTLCRLPTSETLSEFWAVVAGTSGLLAGSLCSCSWPPTADEFALLQLFPQLLSLPSLPVLPPLPFPPDNRETDPQAELCAAGDLFRLLLCCCCCCENLIGSSGELFVVSGGEGT